MVEPLYEMDVDEEDATITTASAIIDAWKHNVPDLAARVLDLQPGQEIIVFKSPQVVVRRLR